MASLTIRNLEGDLKARLRVRAAQHGRSMEEEVRTILRTVLCDNGDRPTNLYEEIRKQIEPLGGVELDVPPREPMREPPDFSE